MPSPHRQVARALFLGLLFIGLAKVAGLGKELAMAWRFGSGPVADAYALTLSLASWPGAVLASVAVAVVVPLMVAARHDDPAKLHLLRREMIAAAMFLGSALGLVVYCSLKMGLLYGWPDLMADTAVEVRRMIGPLSLTVPLVVVSSVLAAWLIASHRQINTLFEGAPSLLLFAALVALPMADSTVVAWTTVAGFGLQFLLLGALQNRPSVLLQPRLGFQSPQWPHLLRGLGVLIVSQSLVSVSGVIDQVAIVPLGPTSNATMGYATRLLLLVQSLASLAIVRALLPVLANADYGDDRVRWRIAVRWAASLSAGAAVVSILGWFMTPWGVGLLFQRGQFTAEDTVRVSEAVRFGLAQIPFYCAGIVLAQYVAATRRYSLFLWGNGLNLLVKIAANAVLIPPLGVPGAMLATAIMYVVSMTFLWIFGRPGRDVSGPSAGGA